MRKWLAVAAVTALVATAAHAQMKGFLASRATSPGHAHTFDMRLSGSSWASPPAPFANGMIADDDVASNATVGIGLVKMRGRKKDGSDLRSGAGAAQTRNPAVTFVVKF